MPIQHHFRSIHSTSGNLLHLDHRERHPYRDLLCRAYAYNADGVEAAYGQTTNPQKTTDLFEVKGISGRHVSLDVALFASRLSLLWRCLGSSTLRRGRGVVSAL
ncbi:hypothetical protein C3L33_14384, partial [Rhododendron williamsianum]